MKNSNSTIINDEKNVIGYIFWFIYHLQILNWKHINLGKIVQFILQGKNIYEGHLSKII